MLDKTMMRMISLQNYFSELTKVFAGPGPGQGGLDEAEKVRQRHPAVRHKWVFHHSPHHHHDKTIVSFKTRQNLLSSSLTSTGQVFGFRGCSFFVPFYIPRISQGLSLRKETDVWHVLTIIIFSFFCNILRIFGLLCICLLHRNRCVTSGLPLNTTTWYLLTAAWILWRTKGTQIHQTSLIQKIFLEKRCTWSIVSDHANLEMEMSKALDRMGDTAMQREDEEDDIGAAFQKFAVVTKELGVLMKNMVSYLHIGTITPTLPLSLPKNHYERPNRKIFGFNTRSSAGSPCLLW